MISFRHVLGISQEQMSKGVVGTHGLGSTYKMHKDLFALKVCHDMGRGGG